MWTLDVDDEDEGDDDVAGAAVIWEVHIDWLNGNTVMLSECCDTHRLLWLLSRATKKASAVCVINTAVQNTCCQFQVTLQLQCFSDHQLRKREEATWFTWNLEDRLNTSVSVVRKVGITSTVSVTQSISLKPSTGGDRKPTKPIGRLIAVINIFLLLFINFAPLHFSGVPFLDCCCPFHAYHF